MAGRPKLNPLDSVPLSNIIFSIARGSNYPRAVAKLVKSDPSTITRQFQILERNRFILEKENDDRFNIKTYEINYSLVIKSFVNYISQIREKNKLDKELMVIPEIMKYQKQLDYSKITQKTKEVLIKDIQLIGYFTRIFSLIPTGRRTVNQIFKQLSKQRIIIKNIKNKELKELIDFTMFTPEDPFLYLVINDINWVTK